MINFTDTDRKFIRKLAASNEELLKRVAALEKKQAPAAELQTWPPDTTPTDSALHKKLSSSVFEMPDDMSSVNVTFKDPNNVSMEQKAFIISLYKTLHELCDDNGVESLSIVIKTV